MWKSINTLRQLMEITTCLCKFQHPFCYRLWSNTRARDYQVSYLYYFYFMKTYLKQMVFEKAERDDDDDDDDDDYDTNIRELYYLQQRF